ncbi:MAG: hypothetical protein WAZ34_14200 [Rhodocyclaceae bacterium]
MLEYQASKAGCAALFANARDICVAKARGREKVAVAELESSEQPSHKASCRVSVARAEAVRISSKKADAKARMKTSDANSTAGEKIQDATKGSGK